MEAPLCLQEVIRVIETPGVGKALGPAGFTPKFYNIFKLILAPRVSKFFTTAFGAKTTIWMVRGLCIFNS